jgi:hypothetical protein
VLRSQTPELVKQEFWGLLMAHYAIRGLMHEAALKADEDPDRLSLPAFGARGPEADGPLRRYSPLSRGKPSMS